MSVTLPVGYHEEYHSMREHDVGIFKRFTDSFYKLVALRSVRKVGYVDSEKIIKTKKGEWRILENNKPSKTISVCKMRESISRTKARVFELALCNNWEHFITLTINSEKADRYVLDEFYKRFSKWIQHYNERTDANIKYLLVPEQHKNGAWHLHGLIMGLPLEHLKVFTLGDKLPSYIRKSIRKGKTLYNWQAYFNAFGYVVVDPVRDLEKCAGYVSKYIFKQAAQTDIGINEHMYYCSQGLKRAVIIYRGQLKRDFVPDFENNYVKIKRFTNINDGMFYLADGNELTTENDIVWKNEDVQRVSFNGSIYNDDAWGEGNGRYDENETWYEYTPTRFVEVEDNSVYEVFYPTFEPVQLAIFTDVPTAFELFPV
jgi:hypothetical protein